MPTNETITLKNWKKRTDRNQKDYLVIKDTNDTPYMVKDVSLFDLVKSSSIINAVINTDLVGSATFRTIVAAQTVQPGALPEVPDEPHGGGSWGGGGGGRSGGYQNAEYPSKRDIGITRQNVLNRGVEIAIALANDGHVELQQGETFGQAIVRIAEGAAGRLEKWVMRDVATPAPPVVPPVPVAQPVPQPSSAPVPQGAFADADVPF